MVFGSLFLLLLIPIVLIFAFGIPVIIGVVVYRDASKRVDCSPWLWALVAALVPSCIGLIVYLIIRKDYPLKPSFEERPGNSYGQENYSGRESDNSQGSYSAQPAEPKKGLPTWGKALIIIGAVVVVICILAAIAVLFFGFFGYSANASGDMYYHHGF